MGIISKPLKSEIMVVLKSQVVIDPKNHTSNPVPLNGGVFYTIPGTTDIASWPEKHLAIEYMNANNLEEDWEPVRLVTDFED